jgi:hypothetical protein
VLPSRHTVELLPDARLEDGVRRLWDRLRDAGLPSLATHSQASNRPHLTVLTAGSLDGLPALPLPVPAELTRVTLLGRALVRLVTPTPELERIHGEVWSALADPDAWPGPTEWTPHVSLALNVPAERRAEALRLLGDLPPEHGHFTAARTYDTGTRTVRGLDRRPAG